MRFTIRSLKLTLALMTLTPLLSGCAIGDLIRLLAGPPETRTVVKVECPDLASPPDGALDALAAKAKTDPATDAWVNDLDRHYTKLDACNGVNG